MEIAKILIHAKCDVNYSDHIGKTVLMSASLAGTHTRDAHTQTQAHTNTHTNTHKQTRNTHTGAKPHTNTHSS